MKSGCRGGGRTGVFSKDGLIPLAIGERGLDVRGKRRKAGFIEPIGEITDRVEAESAEDVIGSGLDGSGEPGVEVDRGAGLKALCRLNEGLIGHWLVLMDEEGFDLGAGGFLTVQS